MSGVKGKCPVRAIKACGGSRGVAPFVLNLGTRWRSVVRLAPQLRGEKLSTCCKSNVGWGLLTVVHSLNDVTCGLALQAESSAAPLTTATATELHTTLTHNIPARVSGSQTSRGQSPAYYREGPCSIPEQSIWDLWRTSWHCRRFVTQYCCFPLSVSFHHASQSVLRPVPGDPWIHFCIFCLKFTCF
jgi:hypothetical protein